MQICYRYWSSHVYIFFSHEDEHKKEVARNKGNTNGVHIYIHILLRIPFYFFRMCRSCSKFNLMQHDMHTQIQFFILFSNGMLIKSKQKRKKRKRERETNEIPHCNVSKSSFFHSFEFDVCTYSIHMYKIMLILFVNLHSTLSS